MLMRGAKASSTEEPDAGKPHVRVCAGGRRVTGVPTARYFKGTNLWNQN